MLTRLRVLMVEDQEDLRELIGSALRDYGIAVTTAADGVAAQALIDSGEEFNVVFTDVRMPNGICGVTLAESIRETRPHARVILTSGFAPEQLPPLPPGVAFLQKPYRLKQLFAILSAVAAAKE
ncbi:response regulator [Stenotrophomonas rhizophila]|uniref:response regulator n=1 Tax=Stenotrophomonas rhizophila TaxID=216778 RepID=UPI00201D272D|nr:response regulator [Stenotrophomonas rhizophila]UQY86207.1 response regulator [Stenotrophomonas rhizophila]